LQVGDSLRENVERGLKECGKCVVVLSPQYFSNDGWTKTEFNSIFTRELIETKRIILPVWYQVTKREVYEYSPSLVDRFAAVWQGDADVVARSLYAPLTGQPRHRGFTTHDTMRAEADS
jgi:TIR domain